jgi:hypothetical protein
MMLCTLGALAQKPDTTTRSPAVKNSTDTSISASADTDVNRNVKPKPKKEKVYHPDTLHNPHKAVMRSLMIPGWGQVYNHRWWKVPVIYAGLSLFTVAIIYNTKYYNQFLAISTYREHGTPPNPGDKYYYEYHLYAAYPDQAIYDATDGYRRDRDLCILGFLGVWGINMIDAYIDAKFISAYTVDNNLSMKVAPTFLNQPVYALTPVGSLIPGIKITFTLR